MEWHSCNPKRPEGKPLCPLATGCWNAQIPGASAFEVVQGKRTHSKWWEQEVDVMIIADGVGWDEDKKIMPIAGRSFEVLKEFLQKSGLDLHKTYITAAVKCRAPRERRPNKAVLSEIKACQRHLEWEIKCFEPKVVILMGEPARRAFNLHSVGSIYSVHGKLFEKQFPGWEDGPVFKIIPTYSPSYFVHKNAKNLRRRVVRDYIFAKNLAKGIETKYDYHRPDYTLCDTVDKVRELRDILNTQEVFAFDTESTCLPFSRAPMICFSFSWGENKNAVVPLYKHNPDGGDLKMEHAWDKLARTMIFKLLKEPFTDEGIAKIAHNIKYDLNVVRKWAGFEIKGYLWDTMIMHHLLEEQGPHDLEFLADTEFSVGDYSADKRAITGHGKKLRRTYDHVPDEILHPYAATDAECVWRLFHTYHQQMVKKPHILKLYDEESYPIMRVLAEAEWYGSRIDENVVENLLEEQKQKQKKVWEKITVITMDPKFNPKSPKQLAKMLTKLGFGDKIKDKRKPSGICTDKEKLESMSGDCPLASLILEHRKYQKLISTYLQKALDEVDQDGSLRYSWKIHGTESGRLSCEFLHQIPRMDEDRIRSGDANLRDFFVAEEGYVYFYGDYSQIEMRVLGEIAGDEELKRVFRDGEDLHKATASGALRIPYSQVSDENRQIGKSINFGLSYGSKGYSLSKNNYYADPITGERKKVTLTMVQEFLQGFAEKYPGVMCYLKDTPILAASANGVLRTVFGRERRIVGLNDPDKSKREHAEREAVNFYIQSTAGAITLRTGINIDKMLRANHVGSNLVRLVNTVHDSLAYEVKIEYLDWFKQAFKIVAEHPIVELNNLTCPVDIGIGKSWGHAELNSKGK